MKKIYMIVVVSLAWLMMNIDLKAQDAPMHPKLTGKGVFMGITPPLRDLPVLSAADYAVMKAKAEKKLLNKKLRTRWYPNAGQALPQGPDEVWQKDMGSSYGNRSPIMNFEGQASPYYPPDANGTVGPNHYMQTINTVYAIYNKTGTLVAGPTNMNLLFSGVTGATCNDGDPLILFDEQADRWLAVEFSICGANNYMLVAVSTTNDPTGTWYKYSFDVDDMPDYEKFGIWRDGYYMGVNNSSGKDIYVFERSQMLIGGASPQFMGFDNSWRPSTIDGFVCVPPVDNDGAFAPTGSPALFIAFNDDAIGGGSDQLWIYELAVNWTTLASSTFVRSQQLAVTPFDSNFGNTWENIPQAGTTQKLDAIPQVIMNVPQYRNFGTYQTIVCCHTVDVDGTDHAGVRWYELRRTTGTWSVRQSGTYAPDAHSRWMGSISLNGYGQIGLGYSVSSSSMNPAIRYCGQSASAYASASGNLDMAETVIINGTNSQTGAERWGDYAGMSVDPANDRTFWFTTEYIGSGGSRKTKIASFQFGNPPTVTTLAATSVSATAATLNGSVNPNGVATTWYFQWGTTASYTSSSTVTSAGSGSASVSVNTPISGLAIATTYHYRLVGVNSDGTTYGSDMTFTTSGAAVVTTTPASSIGLTTAASGGNVTSDGGYTVTARGVCWSTSVNPTISGTHTTDGSGTGTFISSLTGLTANTTYHIRAYATNSNGTFYGDDLTFATLTGLPVVTTTPASSIALTTALSGGNVTTDGGFAVSARGVCWGTTASPTITGSHTSDGSGTGVFTSTLSGLSANTTYHIRAYATNVNGTTYGSDLTFTTLCGTITSFPWTEGFENGGVIPGCWTQEQVSSSGIYWTFITGNGGSKPSAAHGGTYNACFQDATSSSNKTRLITPTINLSSISAPVLKFWHTQANWYGDQDELAIYYKTSAGGTWTLITTYTSDITSWTEETITLPNPSGDYYVAFEGNARYGYGVCLDDVSITGTSGNLPVVTTTTPSSITTSSAISGGNVTSAGTSAVTARGVCWGSSANPTIAGSHTTDGSGTGTFTSTISGLSASTTYHVRAYATNSSGTSYGSDLPFTTSCPTYTLPFSETFTTTTIPACWSQVDHQGNGQIWQFGVIPAGQYPDPSLTGNYAYLNSDGYGNGNSQNADLISPTLDLSGYTTVTLQFSHYFLEYSGSSGSLFYSVNNGVNWTLIQQFTSTSATNPASFNQAIAAVAGQSQVKFKWNYTGTWGYYWAFDNVSITGTSNNLPVVSTTAASSITTTTALSGGTVSSAGSSSVTARGVCWSTTASPTVANSHTTDGTGTGTFTSTIPGLTASTTYHVRAYATNSSGTAYGADLQFTTTCNPLAVSVSIAPSSNPVCPGSIVTFTATPVNGGVSPGYQWKVNNVTVSGASASTYNYSPSNNDQVVCILTSTSTCVTGNPATSNALTMVVTALPGTPLTGTHIPSVTQIIWKWNTVSGATGYKFNSVNDYNTAQNMGTATSKTETGLTPATAYTRYVWAYNDCGNSTPVTLTSSTLVPTHTAPITTAASVGGSAGYSVMVPVTVQNFANITAISLRIDYDPTVLTYTAGSNVNASLTGMIINDLHVSASLHKVLVSWSNVIPVTLPTNAKLFDLAFNYIGGTASVTFNNDTLGGQACEYADENGDPMTDVPTSTYYVNGDVHPGVNISGTFKYDNSAATVLDSLWVALRLSGTKIDSVRTNLNGQYQFNNLTNNTYTISSRCTKPWGGVNSTDAIKIERHFAGIENLSTPVRLLAGDVNNSGLINATDAIKVKRRFAGLENSFARGDWTFAKPTGGDTVIVSGSSVVQNFQGLCVGDVNGSYTPSPGDLYVSGVTLMKDGIVEIRPGSDFDLPLRVKEPGEISAISLVINFPEQSLELLRVSVVEGDVVYNAENGEIRIAWSDLNPLKLKPGDVLLTLRFHLNETVPVGIPVTILAGNESELADDFGNPIENAYLTTPLIMPSRPNSVNEADANIHNVMVYPNPTNGALNVTFDLFSDDNITIALLDQTGRVVSTLLKAELNRGGFRRSFNLQDQSAGIYIVRIIAGSANSPVHNEKLAIIK